MIEGDKVILRPALFDDRKKIFEWLAHADTTSNMLGPPYFDDNPIPTWEEFTNDYTSAYFDDADPEHGKSFIIEVNGEDVGQINYNDIDRNTDTVELDIWMAGSKNCGKGYGSDAINTLCTYLATQHNCHQFILAPSARNDGAIRCYAKCGFKPVGEAPLHFVPDYHDTVIMMKHLPG